MRYEELLHPWIIVRQLPNLQNTTVKRFRRRNDADECLKALRRLSPDAEFIVMFDGAVHAEEKV
ncbi:hypothetical protein IQ250_16865 [Pseudanabaenaceae cyanobacterium LEGE 13415]|nr:hypothetical protein [Pseudanabaenaceae cyanobacterium LEGE 13415]